ncbi:MAG: septum formation protein Maf [Cryomorphaceae bacterium]|nr:septum formation protein Maf [Cryomorphaceae bacterium]
MASNSPRRHQLLREMGIAFTVVQHRAEEVYPAGISGSEIVCFLSEKKAASVIDELADDQILITSDTIVWFEGKPMEKPANKNESREMLTALSGNKHTVYSGVTLMNKIHHKTFWVETEVYFDDISEDEVDYYIDHFKPFDKAGSYGMQDWLGMVKVRKITGSYTNVVGLPTAQLYQNLKEFIQTCKQK